MFRPPQADETRDRLRRNHFALARKTSGNGRPLAFCQVIQQWGSIMQALLTMLFRFYVVMRLLEIRRRRIAV